VKIVQQIRTHIERIHGTMCDAPTELGAEGDVEGRVRPVTLWDAMGYQPDLINPAESDDDEMQAGDFPQVEELLEFGAEIDMGAVKRGLDGKVGEEIRRSILKKGVDGLACYYSFHQRGTQWGIYVYATSLLYLAATVFDHLPVDPNTKLQLSFRALHQHELFHFAVDYMASQWEAIVEKACYVPARSRLRDPAAGYILLEEELANAHMIRAMRGGRKHMRVKARTDALRAFVKTQPPGYRDGGNSTSAAVFEERSGKLIREYVQSIEDYQALCLGAVDLFRLFPIDPAIDWRYCPIHIVHDEHRFAVNPIALGLFQSVCGIQETLSFRKRFERLPEHIRRKWLQTKQKIGCTTALPGLDFKRWRHDQEARVYSVRLDRSYRAHLQYGGEPPSWSAIEIGTHQELGHG
jgi:hypothetical protein